MTRWIMIWVLACIALAGCGSAPPLPVERFYRLQPVSLAAPKLGGALVVGRFGADSVYAERPLVYADGSDPRQLRQYHYHLWLYPAGQLVRDHLAVSLGSFSQVAGREPTLELEGRIVRFERLLSPQGSRAVATVEMQLSVRGKPALIRHYHAEVAAADQSVVAFVVAMEQALAKIYGEFLTDAAKIDSSGRVDR